MKNTIAVFPILENKKAMPDALLAWKGLKNKKQHKKAKNGMQVKKKKKEQKRWIPNASQQTKKGMEEQLRAAMAGTKVTFNNKYGRAGKVHGTSRLQKSRQ